MSTSATANNPSWVTPESTIAPFCTPLNSSHLFLGTEPPPLLDMGISIHHQNGRASNTSFAQRLQGFVGLIQREGDHLRAHRNPRGQSEELLAVLAGEVRHRAENALAPEDLVWERRYVAHVDAGAHHHSRLRHCPQRRGHQRAHGCEDYGRVQLLRRRLVRAPGPRGPESAGEPLALLVARAGEGEDPPPLRHGDLSDD